MKLSEFKYDVEELELDFYGISKIDVFIEGELFLEIEKFDNAIWVISTHRIEENVITIKEAKQNELVNFIGDKILEKFNTELPVIVHPNFFLVIEDSNQS